MIKFWSLSSFLDFFIAKVLCLFIHNEWMILWDCEYHILKHLKFNTLVYIDLYNCKLLLKRLQNGDVLILSFFLHLLLAFCHYLLYIFKKVINMDSWIIFYSIHYSLLLFIFISKFPTFDQWEPLQAGSDVPLAWSYQFMSTSLL